ncbi:NERD domain-containing protein [Candidatus Riflebacteria bacterium]
MARMLPNIAPEIIENKAEGEVYAQLRDQLPGSWVARHHFAVCCKQGWFLREREVDFIVMVPNKGLVFLEVKGSYGLYCEGGSWYRVLKNGDRKKTTNPFEQATKAKHELVALLCKKLGWGDKFEFPGLYCHAVVYPFGKLKGQLPGSLDRQLLITYKDMGHLEEIINELFYLTGATGVAKEFTPKIMAKVVKFFGEECHLVPVLASDVDKDDRKIENLTRQQFNFFRSTRKIPRIFVEGTAGSGKTLLAIWAAQSFAEEKEKTLLVCFNRLLASWIKLKIQGSTFEVKSFFSLCHEYLTRAGIKFGPDRQGQDFWKQTAPGLFCEAIEKCGNNYCYDTILVDEAQDFHQDWWLPLQLLLKDPDRGRFYIFHDPEQSGLYGMGDAYPVDGMVPIQLFENCRNTKSIASFNGKVISKKIKTFPRSPTGVIPKILDTIPAVKDRAEETRTIIQDWLRQQFGPSRIAVLSPWKKGKENSTLTYLKKAHTIPLASEENQLKNWHMEKIIWGTTIKSFKGLEADCIVITDIPTTGTKGFSQSDLYVAISRAKHRLVLLPLSEPAKQELFKWHSMVE